MGACASFASSRPHQVRPDPSATESTMLNDTAHGLFDINMDVYKFLDQVHSSIPENTTAIHSIPSQPFRLLMLGKYTIQFK